MSGRLLVTSMVAPTRRASGFAFGGPGISAVLGAALMLLLIQAVMPPLAGAADPCAGDLLDRVQAEYQSLRAFKGRFAQQDRQSDGSLRRAEGEVAYLKPGRMRWRYDPPNEQLLVTDGETVWLYDPILDNVTVQPLSDLTAGTPLAFLLGAGDLKSDFLCREYSRPPPGDGLIYLELVPRKPIPALDFIQLGVRAGNERIAALIMVDSQGNARWVRFFDLKTDVSFPDSFFTFEVTAEMEVITKSAR